MKTRCLILALAWSAAYLSLGGLTSAAEEVTTVDLAGKFVDFALNPETGDLAAIDPKANTVTLFREAFLTGKDAAKPLSLKVGNLPFAIAYKKYKTRGTFAIVCTSDSNMYLVDAKEMTLLRKIPLGSSDARYVAASRDAADPYVYYCFGTGHDSVTGRVNLAKLADEGMVFDHSMDCAVSSSGKLFYRRGPWSPSGFECLRLAEGEGPGGKGRFDRVFYDHNSTAQYVPDPFDFYTAAGANVYTAELKKKVATVEFSVAGFLPHRPLIFGFKDQDLVFASFNTFRTAGRVTMPAGLSENSRFPREDPSETIKLDPNGEGRSVRTKLCTFADGERDRVVVAKGSKVALVSLAKIELPSEPFLLARVSDQPGFTVGLPGKLKLSLVDARTKLEIAEPPAGMKVTGDTLAWTPTVDQVGRHQLNIGLSHGDISTTQMVPVDVAFPSAKLPFLAGALAVSPLDETAVCWQQQSSQDFSVPREEAAPDPTTRMAIVDLATLKVVAEARVPFRVTAAATDGKQVFVAQQGSNQLVYFTALEPAKQKSLAASDDVLSLQVVNTNLFASLKTGGIACWTLPDMKLNPALGKATATQERMGIEFDQRQQQPQAVTRIRDGWLLNHVLYDSELKTPRLLLGAPGLSLAGGRVGPAFPGMPGMRNGGASGALSSWGKLPQPARQVYSGLSGQTQQASVVLDDVPALVTAAATIQQKNVSTHTYSTEQTLKLTVDDLAAGVHQQTVNLAVREAPQVHNRAAAAVVVRPLTSGVAVLHGDSLYRYAIPNAILEKLPQPLVIEPRQSTFVLDSKQPTKLTHSLPGAKKPIQAALTISRAEISIDSETAAVTVDGPKLLAALEQQITEPGRFELLEPNSSPQAALMSLQATSAPMFEKITGRKPVGLPAAIPIGIRVVDADSRIAEINYVVLLELPQDRVLKKLEERAVEMEKLRAKQKELALEQSTGKGGRPGLAPAATEERLRQMEERLRALETKLDLLTRLLGDRVKEQK